MTGTGLEGEYDFVLSMGVLHHTSHPSQALKNISSLLTDDGMLFAYVYGRLGARERMRRKTIVSLLMKGEDQNFDHGIHMVRELGFDLEGFGWSTENEDPATIEGLIVDSYLNVNDVLFDLTSVTELMQTSTLYGFAPYGLTIGQTGLLFDAFPEHGRRALAPTANFSSTLKSETVRDAFEKLDLASRFQLADLIYEPNGYTLLGFTRKAHEKLVDHSRLKANTRIFD